MLIGQEDQPWEFLHLFTEIKSALESEREAKELKEEEEERKLRPAEAEPSFP